MAKNVNSPEVKPIGLSPDIVSEVDDDSNISSELVSSSSFQTDDEFESSNDSYDNETPQTAQLVPDKKTVQH